MGHYLVDTCPFWGFIFLFTVMSIKQIDFSKVLSDDQVYDFMMANYGSLGKDWVAHQWNWMNYVYFPFKDHYKYLILISLIEKTFKFYEEVDITLSYDQFYSKSYLQIEKFSILELCEKLNLPKETVRRKVLELENLGVLKRRKKQIVIDRSAFNFVKPENQIKFTSKYIFLVSKILNTKNIYSKKIDSKYIESIIKKNYSICWRWYFAMQIPMIIGYENYFKDIATFHVWGTVVMNQAFNYSKIFDKTKIQTLTPDYVTYNKNFINSNEKSNGVSAMSISDMTSIPRATVIRKCKYLVKNNYLNLNDRNQYILTGENTAKLVPFQKEIFKLKSKYITKILNLCLIS